MKKSISIIVTMTIIGSFFIQSSHVVQSVQDKSIYTAEVKKVIDEKCYGCHSVNGKSEKAKNSLLWDSLPNLQKNKLVATLDNIVKVLKKSEMPPQSAVKRNPEMKLLPGESKILQSWAESTADRLLK